MIIDINEDYVKIVNQTSLGTKVKFVQLSELLEKLSSFRTTSFGLLPKDTRMLESSGLFTLVGMEFPPKTRTVTFNAERYSDKKPLTIDASLPGGVFFVILKREATQYRFMESFIYAVKGNRITFDTDRLYKYPMPNIHSDGRICWGNIVHPLFERLSAVEGLMLKFFSGNFNSDLFSSSNTTCPERTTIQAYLEYLSRNHHKDEWLVPTEFQVKQIAQTLLRKI